MINTAEPVDINPITDDQDQSRRRDRKMPDVMIPTTLKHIPPSTRRRRESKVSDSGVSDMSTSPTSPKERRMSGSAVAHPDDVEDEGGSVEVIDKLKKLKWHINTPASKLDHIDAPDLLSQPLTSPPLRVLHLIFPQGLTLTVRNTKTGVTVKDAMDMIYKKFKKMKDDEIPEGVLGGFVWDKEEYGFGGLGVVLARQ
ncbi:hypothetical protein SAICODRAFT_69089 [Saitoella complicata NRRL Y-17804]|nr:uncharacterized protein SAICODRAFT_69089 [Saitoella complicata NRRL Y-17804]ODQ55761.1 hypothetical protein SAICODRAFT_69089 [Saitoella complicata NRRL Y-17804]